MVVSDSTRHFKQGDDVVVRDSSGTSWLHGVVTSVSPLEVQVNGWPIPMSFKHVRLNVGGNDAKETGVKLLKKLDLRWLHRCTLVPGSNSRHRYYDPKVRHLSSEDGAALRTAWNIYERENSLWCSEAPIIDIVLSYLIDEKAKRREEEVGGTDTQWWLSKYAPHFLGKNGSVINSIRRKTLAKITLVDERTEFLPEDLRRNKRQEGWNKLRLSSRCYLKVEGTTRQIQVVKTFFSEIAQRVNEYEMKKARWLRRKRRTTVSRSYSCAREKWVKEMWYMQKLQHGAKGDWFVSKHKRKGRDKGQKKTRKHKQAGKRVKASGGRKPKRSFTMEVSNRRVRLSF